MGGSAVVHTEPPHTEPPHTIGIGIEVGFDVPLAKKKDKSVASQHLLHYSRLHDVAETRPIARD